MTDFYKVLRLGLLADGRGVCYCEVNFTGGKLSITGNAKGSCGQINMYLKPSGFTRFEKGWDEWKVAEFLTIWYKWHLNDMKAGTPEQTEALKPFFAERKYPDKDYTHACEYLAERGLLSVPDPRYPAADWKDQILYKYGSAWLSVEVPADVLAWLQALPDSPTPLPGAWAKPH